MQFAEIYRGIDNRYGLFKGFGNTDPKTGKKTKRIDVPHGSPPYNAHLDGDIKIGIYPFTEDKKVAWGCIDIDDYISLDIPKVAKQVKELGLPGVVTRSTNGGAHIWFHFTQSVNAKQLRNKLRDIRDAMRLDPKTELFPKQDDIDIKNNTLGNFVFIPYSGGARGGSYAVNDETGEAIQTIEEFEKYVATKTLNSVNDIKVNKQSLAPDYDEPEEITEYQDQDLELKDLMGEAPPCLRAILDIKDGLDNHRDNALYGFAVLSKKAKGKAVKKDIETANNTFQQPLQDKDLNRIIRSVNSKEYQYKCKDNPLEAYCSSDECKMMKYGIGAGAKEKSYFDNFVYCYQGPKVIQLKPTLRELDFNEAKAKMNTDLGKIQRGKTKVLAGEVWHLELAKRNAVDVIKWHPGKPLFYEEPGDNGSVIKCVNTYRPTTRVPVAGDIDIFLNFMKARIKEDKFREYFYDRIAFLIQHPGKRCPVIPVFVSDDGGTGKSIIDLILVELVGRYNISNIDLETFSAGWSDFFRNKLWVTIEEISTTGKQKGDINSALKRWSSTKWSTNNIKFGKISNEPDEMFCNFNINSNSKTAMTIKDGDRRLFIIRFDNDKTELRVQNKEEGTALYKWCEEEQGYEKILNFFKTRDIKQFDPFDWPPETNAKKEMILNTTGWKFKKLFEAYEDNRWPFYPGVKIYCPFHLAEIFDLDKEDCLTNMKKYMHIEKICRVQNVQWERHYDSGHHIHSTPGDYNLWTNEPNFIELKPIQATKLYLHPVQSKAFGKHFVQDKRHKEWLQREFGNALDIPEDPEIPF